MYSGDERLLRDPLLKLQRREEDLPRALTAVLGGDGSEFLHICAAQRLLTLAHGADAVPVGAKERVAVRDEEVAAAAADHSAASIKMNL